MISFASDYLAGAHPEVLRRLVETNLEPLPGYGSDSYSERAREKIRAASSAPEAGVEFLTGGTQANAVVLAALLGDGEGVLAAESGHIAVHEAGAVEYSGHKVLTLPQREGKIASEALSAWLAAFYADPNCEHMVRPGALYLSHPTEYGTLYSLAELTQIASVCRRYGVRLYLDGARLGYALACPASDVALSDLARLCDAFTIGGTKVGALCGEAVVFRREAMPPHFLGAVKRRGALLAKGRLLGVQFDALFTDGLYFRIGRYAAQMTDKLRTILTRCGLRLYLDSPTNQQFVVLPDAALARLREQVDVSVWEKPDAAHTVVRFAVSWSTTEEELETLERVLREIPGIRS